jgi:formate hydrogenlyase transcriptional activator
MQNSVSLPGSGSIERYQLLLQLAKAANSRLDFSDVLAALGSHLSPIHEVRYVAVLIVEGDEYLPYSLYVTNQTRVAGESFSEVLARFAEVPAEDVPVRIPMEGSVMEHVRRTGRPYVCGDLESTVRFAEERRLLSYGIRSYVLCPLLVRERMIGAIHFIREAPHDYSPDEISLFSEIAEVAAIALSNALAYAEIDTLRHKLQEENLVLRDNIAEISGFEELVGASAGLKRVLASIEKVAATDSTVLILGETGTGKELIAKAIHQRSRRALRPLVKVNCAAIPESLVASELFGHERGAFTGAMQRRIGRFEMANQSSLFLDEVGELPLETQVALLRVLQEREFERVGGTQTIRSDVRLIAATNRDLSGDIDAGRFRTDLFYRLNVFPIEVPPLRERREDIPMLVEYFSARSGERIGKRVERIQNETMSFLIEYDWPGNIRELQNVIERGVILAENGTLRLERSVFGTRNQSVPETNVLERQERDLIEAALVETNGRIAGRNGAAARLGLPPSTLESKIRALKIDKHHYRSNLSHNRMYRGTPVN